MKKGLLFVLMIVVVFLSLAVGVDENRSWLADDMLDIYHEGTLNFLGDPTGAGLSVYDNYVFYVRGDTYLRSKWKTPPISHQTRAGPGARAMSAVGHILPRGPS